MAKGLILKGVQGTFPQREADRVFLFKSKSKVLEIPLAS